MCEFFYETHINYKKYVLDFFEDKKDKLLIINLIDDDNEYNLKKLNNFFPNLNILSIPHKNKSTFKNDDILLKNIEIIDNFLKIKNLV